MVNSKQKGKRGELEFVNYLKKRGYDARRGQQFKGSSDSPDVVCRGLPFHWEVKRRERFTLYECLNQAIMESEGTSIPAVAHRKNGEEWVIVMRMDDFFDLYEKKEKNS